MNEKAYTVISRMTDAEWTILILRLGRYALRTSRNLDWRTQNSHELPGSETVDSIVSKAFEKLFSGERKWDPDEHPSLEKYLMDVIDSLLNHLAQSDDNTKLEAVAKEEDGLNAQNIQAGRSEAAAEWLTNSCQTPESILLKQERDRRNEEALGILISECDGNPVLKKLLEAIFDGYVTARSIAERTGLTRAEVYNANKRLDRKIDLVRKRMNLEKLTPVTKGKQNV